MIPPAQADLGLVGLPNYSRADVAASNLKQRKLNIPPVPPLNQPPTAPVAPAVTPGVTSPTSLMGAVKNALDKRMQQSKGGFDPQIQQALMAAQAGGDITKYQGYETMDPGVAANIGRIEQQGLTGRAQQLIDMYKAYQGESDTTLKDMTEAFKEQQTMETNKAQQSIANELAIANIQNDTPVGETFTISGKVYQGLKRPTASGGGGSFYLPSSGPAALTPAQQAQIAWANKQQTDLKKLKSELQGVQESDKYKMGLGAIRSLPGSLGVLGGVFSKILPGIDTSIDNTLAGTDAAVAEPDKTSQEKLDTLTGMGYIGKTIKEQKAYMAQPSLVESKYKTLIEEPVQAVVDQVNLGTPIDQAMRGRSTLFLPLVIEKLDKGKSLADVKLGYQGKQSAITSQGTQYGKVAPAVDSAVKSINNLMSFADQIDPYTGNRIANKAKAYFNGEIAFDSDIQAWKGLVNDARTQYELALAGGYAPGKAQIDAAAQAIPDDVDPTTLAEIRDVNIPALLLRSQAYGDVSAARSFGAQPSAGPAGTIRVKDKASGQTGTIPSDEYDPSIYDKIQ